MKLKYNPKLKEYAKELRKNSTLSEVILWRHLKNRQMKGYDFHRQKPIDEYIVDFFCHKLKLVIEIDGDTHNYKILKDKERQDRLESLELHFLRFLDSDIKNNLEDVLYVIDVLFLFIHNTHCNKTNKKSKRHII